MSDLYVANTSAEVTVGGQRRWIKKGETIVRAGHPVMKGREKMFSPIHIHYDTVEQATAAPGEKRDIGVHRCDHPGCDATAKSPAGLAAHKRSHNGDED